MLRRTHLLLADADLTAGHPSVSAARTVVSRAAADSMEHFLRPGFVPGSQLVDVNGLLSTLATDRARYMAPEDLPVPAVRLAAFVAGTILTAARLTLLISMGAFV